MDYEFIFKKGQYKGKTVGWVDDNDPSYLVWVEECKPEMLEDKPEKQKPTNPVYLEPELDTVESAIKPNLNFDNEGKVNNEKKD